MLTRRHFLGASAGCVAAAAFGGGARGASSSTGTWVNDIHSRLNRTLVRGIERPTSIEALEQLVRRARAERQPLCIAGGRHAMGGQQFGTGSLLVDTTGLTQVLAFDAEAGHIEVGAGIQWPELVDHLLAVQQGVPRPWGIVQKQTGADRLCLGGALAANAHGRGLDLRPIVQDVESFDLVDASGKLRHCSRSENEELFRLAIGGYGLFGVIASVRLRLTRRRKLERVVEIVEIGDLMRRFDERRAQGFRFGDFQYATALDSEAALRTGVFSCYRPVADETPAPGPQRRLADDDWRELLVLAHVDPARAFDEYARYYLSTTGQIYWSDTHQMSTYVDDYHSELSARLGRLSHGSEMISEIYVPRDALVPFMDGVRQDLRKREAKLIYGTIRLIERDDETLLPWAREPWVCIIFNLHTQHDAGALQKTASDFRALIDQAIAHDGSYFLTYHRWASREQTLACHPAFPRFLERKRDLDPEERFSSDWYRHHQELFGMKS